ncbi:MAG: endonuclease/exonuclease/phosphatase family protein [Spirochaetaceae bacterium]|nr:endonuclease/exonuclease/phosphatase family protein [Spirochaetaceae bacterium]
MIKKRYFIIKIGLLLSLFVYIELSRLQLGSAIILSYNVQNLFDDITTGTEYNEFTCPNWTTRHYESRLVSLSEVFTAIKLHKGRPDLIFLQEVESAEALAALLKATPALGRMQPVFAKHPQAAIGLAMLSRYPITQVELLDSSLFNTISRPIMVVHLNIKGKTVIAINVHLPSQLNPDGQITRAAAINLIAKKLKDLQVSGFNYFMVAGDFNSDNSDELFGPLLELGLINVLAHETGSYYFRGNWQQLDQIYLSPALFERQSPLKIGRANNIRLAPLLTPLNDDEDSYLIPFRFASYAMRGFSDHLPVMLHINY